MLRIVIKIEIIILVIGEAFFTGLIVYFKIWDGLPYLLVVSVGTAVIYYYIAWCVIEIKENNESVTFTRFNGRVIVIDKSKIKSRIEICEHQIFKLDDGRILHTNPKMISLEKRTRKYGDYHGDR